MFEHSAFCPFQTDTIWRYYTISAEKTADARNSPVHEMVYSCYFMSFPSSNENLTEGKDWGIVKKKGWKEGVDMDKSVFLKFNVCGFSEDEKKRLDELYSAYATAKVALMSYFQEIMAPDCTIERIEK